MEEKIASLIAPCGMNCAICVSFFDYTLSGKKRKHPCIGCRPRDKQCVFLKRDCEILRENQITFCFECDKFACQNLIKLDERYRGKYEMSMIENLKEIKNKGLEIFVKNQNEKYKCPDCGRLISVHTGRCYNCEYIK